MTLYHFALFRKKYDQITILRQDIMDYITVRRQPKNGSVPTLDYISFGGKGVKAPLERPYVANTSNGYKPRDRRKKKETLYYTLEQKIPFFHP